MIERKFVAQKLKEKQIQEYIAVQLERSGHSKIEIKRTPLGDKIIVYTTRPGVIVGKRGEHIKKLTRVLKTKFKMENPQIEVSEIENPLLDPNSVADQIVYTLERFGSKRFKFTGYDMLSKIMNAGATGAEIIIGGRGVPGMRAKSWKFSAGHLKKSGDISESHVLRSKVTAKLKSGAIGVKVTILHPDTVLPDSINVMDDVEIVVEKEKPKRKRKVKKKTEEKKKVEKEGKNEKSTGEKDGNNKEK